MPCRRCVYFVPVIISGPWLLHQTAYVEWCNPIVRLLINICAVVQQQRYNVFHLNSIRTACVVKRRVPARLLVHVDPEGKVRRMSSASPLRRPFAYRSRCTTCWRNLKPGENSDVHQRRRAETPKVGPRCRLGGD